MINNMSFFLKLIVSIIPFVLLILANGGANVKREIRNRQYLMPLVAVIYSIVLLILMDKLSNACLNMTSALAEKLESISVTAAERIRDIVTNQGMYLALILFNILALLVYVIVKKIITVAFARRPVRPGSFIGSVSDVFYAYDELSGRWFIKKHFGQARAFLKTIYVGSVVISCVLLLISCYLCKENLVAEPFYPVFAVIILGELAFFIDGAQPVEEESGMAVETDNSRHIAIYPLLIRPLKALFGDKLSADGTTINNGGVKGGAVEDILANLEENGKHIGRNYAAFIRKKMQDGLKPNIDYVRCGYDLAVGKSLLFGTPFYDKISPYSFYAMNRCLLNGGKVLIVLGRHGTEDDLYQWCEKGMMEVSNIPNLWKVRVLSDTRYSEDEMPDIGIISRSGVHDLGIHKVNLEFLRNVSFVVIVEPSRLITTAQIGLNLLIKNCGEDRDITFCSIDRNCDGLVDALSHILMTNITEVSATEYPHGISSYMYWLSDGDHLQHRIVPGISRYLGMGTELSMVALKNQVKKTVWYGGDAFPVRDAHWIAKQYYHDLLDYAQLPTNQETFDRSFQVSFNLCNEKVNDYSFITVEDDRNNLFEIRRSFATMAEQQGFVNVISSEYMLREYMAQNTELFTVDAKAIPYITADFARTKRNAVLSLCLQLSIGLVKEEVLHRQLVVLNIDAQEPVKEIWKEICMIFGGEPCETDKNGTPILVVKSKLGSAVRFERDRTILYKREYSVDSGKFENFYVIENADFTRLILDDLQNASYIAEQESRDTYLGTELKGHIYQKYLPGQFFTLNGKYYEMVTAAVGNRITVRRASEHIGSRLAYRQVRNYKLHRAENACVMGEQKVVNNIGIFYQYVDFSVETPGYWKLSAYNDFEKGSLVEVNSIPTREYHHKQILKLDFSNLGDAFTDTIRMTLTNLLNEVFVTLFADNHPYISAVTPGKYDAPLTYSLEFDEDEDAASEKCIYIFEDSQLDIGLLVAVERNINRIFQIISDYLSWNEEAIRESLIAQNASAEKPKPQAFSVYEESEEEKKPEKRNFFRKICDWFEKIFRKKKRSKDEPEKTEEASAETTSEAETPAEAKVSGEVMESEAEEAVETETTAEKATESVKEEAPAEEAAEATEAETSAEEIEGTTEEEKPVEEAVVVTEVEISAEETKGATEAETPVEETAKAPAETPAEEKTAEVLTPKQQRKAEKAEKKALKQQKKEQKETTEEKGIRKVLSGLRQKFRKNASAENEVKTDE